MTSLADAIRAEARALEAIASAPLPDLTYLSIDKEGNRANNDENDTDDVDIISLRKEIKALLDEAACSKWELDAPHTLNVNECVPDIRALRSDAKKLLNDKDGDKASLYWYILSKSEVRSNDDLAQDSIYHELANRVSFGFSLTRRQKEENNADAQATQLMRGIEAANTLEQHKWRQSRDDAACVIQRFFRSWNRKQTHRKRGIIIPISNSSTTKSTPLQQCSQGAQTSNYLMSNVNSTRKQEVTSTDLMSRMCAANIQGQTMSCRPSDAVVLSTERPKENEWFIDGLLNKMDTYMNNIASQDGTNAPVLPISMTARRVREVFRPFVVKLVKAGSIYGADASILVDLINCKTHRLDTWTSEYFTSLIMSTALSLSTNLVEAMGGEEAIIQACGLVYKHFFVNNELSSDELSLFLQDVFASGSSRISASFVGRLLERAGSKDGLSGLHVVNSFMKTFQSSHTQEAPEIPQSAFLKWLASLKPKFSATEMDGLLSDVLCPHDANLVSMSKFIQICFPMRKMDAGTFNRKLSVIFSEQVVGPTWLNQLIESCKEKDLQQSGYVGWKDFLEIVDDTPILLTASEANQLASMLADKASLTVKYSGLKYF